MIRRTFIVYALLLAAWVLVIAWQVAEHKRVRDSARTALINRAKDISDTLGLVMRSQRQFGGTISKDRLESALGELADDELTSVAVLNAAGEVIASAGVPIDFPHTRVVQTGQYWARDSLTILNLVDFGEHVARDFERITPIVRSRDDMVAPPSGRPPGPPPSPQTATERASNGAERGPRRRFGRPGWMSEEEYQARIPKQGVHSFIMVLSTGSVSAAVSYDLWLRTIIGFLASVSAVGCGLAWRNLARSSDLQIRLVRASELNSHLKEMNLAAAGLAHETRNPLNIIRGFAQIISRHQTAPPEIREKSVEIIEETDRVTAQLSEFINYSRPREIRLSPVPLRTLVSEVIRTLNYDIQEKTIAVQVCVDPIAIEADEQLLRQVLFNLLMNAIQAVPTGGEIMVRAVARNGSQAVLELIDNGPGVLPEHRSEIFKPYFTTHQMGTGLGLAIVQQIVLTHGWEIECVPNEPKGSIFRITHLRLSRGH